MTASSCGTAAPTVKSAPPAGEQQHTRKHHNIADTVSCVAGATASNQRGVDYSLKQAAAPARAHTHINTPQGMYYLQPSSVLSCPCVGCCYSRAPQGEQCRPGCATLAQRRTRMPPAATPGGRCRGLQYKQAFASKQAAEHFTNRWLNT